jgi:hypothetical protein
MSGTSRKDELCINWRAGSLTGQRSNQLNYVPTLKIQDFDKSRWSAGTTVCGERCDGMLSAL